VIKNDIAGRLAVNRPVCDTNQPN